MPPSQWDQRIARAQTLASAHPPVASVLTFYAALATYQKSILGHWRPAKTADTFREALNIDHILSNIPPFLSWLQDEASAPAPLREEARASGKVAPSAWRILVESYLASLCGPRSPLPNPQPLIPNPHSPLPDPQSFVIEAVLQPFAEAISLSRGETDHTGPTASTPRCPVCGSPPTLGVLREEGHGAKRGLLCALCFTEWNYLRVVCPACAEQRFDELPVYTAEQFPSVRVDACENCHTYLKTLDLTKDGLAVPIVDDIASVALDFWAREQGYVRLHPNLLRTG